MYVVLEAACFVSKYTEFGFAFYVLAAFLSLPGFGVEEGLTWNNQTLQIRGKGIVAQ